MPTMTEDVETRIVVREFKINTYWSDQLQPGGNVSEDERSIEKTGHNQVPIPYDKKLFRVVDKSRTLLEEISVDEGMVDLLRAVWKHGIPTIRSCQGGNGEAWISFESFEDTGHFFDLVSNLLSKKWKQDSDKNKKNFQVSFPQEDISKITEELNKAVTPQLIKLASIHITTK